MADREPEDIAPAPAKIGRKPVDYRPLAIAAIKLVLREGITRTKAAAEVAAAAKACPHKYPATPERIARAILDVIAGSAETAETDKRDAILTPGQRLAAMAAHDALWTEAYRQLLEERLPIRDTRSKEAPLAQMYAAQPHLAPELASAIEREIAEHRRRLSTFRETFADILPPDLPENELIAAYAAAGKALIAHFDVGTATKTP